MSNPHFPSPDQSRHREQNRLFCVGLTGGIGSGKSTVTGIFQELGAKIIDADIITRELQAVDQPAYNEIIKQFGPEVVGEHGELNRTYLRKLVFTDHELKTKLENIVHPLVRAEINRRLNSNTHPYCIISIPLLFENGAQYDFDRILVVDIPEDLQIIRAGNRDGVNKNEIVKIINSQIKREKRLEKADDVICNDKSIDILTKAVKKLHNQYLQLARHR